MYSGPSGVNGDVQWSQWSPSGVTVAGTVESQWPVQWDTVAGAVVQWDTVAGAVVQWGNSADTVGT